MCTSNGISSTIIHTPRRTDVCCRPCVHPRLHRRYKSSSRQQADYESIVFLRWLWRHDVGRLGCILDVQGIRGNQTCSPMELLSETNDVDSVRCAWEKVHFDDTYPRSTGCQTENQSCPIGHQCRNCQDRQMLASRQCKKNWSTSVQVAFRPHLR